MATIPAGYIFHNNFYYTNAGAGPYYIDATGTPVLVGTPVSVPAGYLFQNRLWQARDGSGPGYIDIDRQAYALGVSAVPAAGLFKFAGFWYGRDNTGPYYIDSKGAAYTVGTVTSTALPQIGSLIARWSADDIAPVADGTAITSWTDSVGGNVAVQGTTTAPVYKVNRLGSKPSVQFGGTRYLTAGRPAAIVAAIDSGTFTVLLVQKALGAIPSFGSCFHAFVTTAGFYMGFSGTKTGELVNSMSEHGSSSQQAFHTLACSSGIINGQTWMRTAINGTVTTAQNWVTTLGNPILFGALSDGSMNSNTDCFDILVWNVRLTPAELIQAHKWACDKYGQAYPWAPYGDFQVFHGDSLTIGLNIAEPGTNAYPTQMAKVALGRPFGTWTNLGISGILMSTMNTMAPLEFDTISTLTGRYTTLMCWEWYNQRGASPGPRNNSITYLNARRAASTRMRIVFGTSSASTDLQSDRDAYNSYFDANFASLCDAYVPIHTDVNIGVSGAQVNATYFNGDQLHFTIAGHTVESGLFQTGYNALPVVYSITGPTGGSNGSPSSAFELLMSKQATAGQTITVASAGGTISVTASGATITGNGSGSVQVTLPSAMVVFTFTFTPSSTGAKTITYTNGQAWTNPSASGYLAA